MMHTPSQFTVGATTISLFQIGALQVRLAEWLGLVEGDWPPIYQALFAAPIAVPVQCAHIALPGRSLLVDPCHPELLAHSGELVPGATPMLSLLMQLAAAQVDPLTVDTVVITHPHFDHYCGIVAIGASAAEDRLLFPNARHLLGQADWAALQDDLKSPASPTSRALGLAWRHGILELVGEQRELGDGLSLLPTPGETPGHLALRVESQGATLYCVGDLFHHQVEVERPEWGVTWADAAATARSRAALLTAAQAEHALLIAAHIQGVGRPARDGAGVHWGQVE